MEGGAMEGSLLVDSDMLRLVLKSVMLVEQAELEGDWEEAGDM